MHPILINIGPFTIHTYGFLIACGFLVALSLAKRLAIRSKLNVEKTLDLGFWCMFVGFIGARLLYIITRFNDFAVDPLAVFKIWEGGLVFFGGPLTAIPFAIWYAKKHEIPIWKTLDVFTPGLAVAHAFGRLGCFSAGCCYGKPTDGPFGVRFHSDLVALQYRGIPLHPTQLYESFSLFILFAGLMYIYKKRVFDGQVALSYLLIYPIIRSVIETFRGDLIRGFVVDGVLSTSQFISILVFIGAAVVFRKRAIDSKI